MINRNNYEIYAIDYLEGKLTGEKLQEFENFLRLNPDIAAELEELAGIRLQPDSIVFKPKDSLKKSPVPGITYFDYLCISHLEGTATKDEQKELAKIIKSDPEKARIFEQYQKTVLQAPAVFYPYKNKLKRPATNLGSIIIKIAAAVLIFFSALTLKQQHTNNTDFNFALKAAEPIINYEPRQPRQLVVPRTVEQIQQKNRISIAAKDTTDKTRMTTEIVQIPKPELRILDTASIKTVDIQLNINPVFSYNINKREQLDEILFKKLQDYTRKRGIIITKKQITVTVNNKTYGICLH